MGRADFPSFSWTLVAPSSSPSSPSWALASASSGPSGCDPTRHSSSRSDRSSCAAAQALGLVTGLDWLCPALLLVASAPNVLLLRRFRRSPAPAFGALCRLGRLQDVGRSLPGSPVLRSSPRPSSPGTALPPDGTFLLDPIAPYDDAVFHVGLARELTLGLPPQVPGLSGVTLGYHLGQGLGPGRGAPLRGDRALRPHQPLRPRPAVPRPDPGPARPRGPDRPAAAGGDPGGLQPALPPTSRSCSRATPRPSTGPTCSRATCSSPWPT